MKEDLSPPATPPTCSPVPSRLCIVVKEDEEVTLLKEAFQLLTPFQKQYFLMDIINNSDNSQLAYLNSIISPRLKVDFIKELPPEIAVYILSFIDSPSTLAGAHCVSKYWNTLIRNNTTLWRSLCQSHNYYLPKEEEEISSYRDYFKRQYSIRNAWNKGGKVTTVDSGFSHGLVTSLQFDEKYTVIGCDNHCIEIFDTNSGKKIRTLEGHEGGVWALQFKGGEKEDPERVLLSGGCDR